MNKKFVDKLTEFLESECSDYGLGYDWVVSDCHDNAITVSIVRENTDLSIDVDFRFNGFSLEIEMGDDNWEVVKEYDYTVKYFWMLVSPTLFPNN